MKFAIFGTGGVGGYFGGRLAQAGQDVTFIARGAHRLAIVESGLRVDSINGNFSVQPAKVTDDISSIGVVDVVLVATKAWDVPDVALAIKPLVGADTLVVPLGNGVDAPSHLMAVLGADSVLGGFCRISAFIAEPGLIRHVGVAPYIAFGELDGTESERVLRLRDVFASCEGLTVEVPADIQAGMWEKFVFIAAISGVGAVTRQPLGVFRAVAESRALLISALEETVAVAWACGINLPADQVHKTLAFIDGTAPGVVASMHKDIMEGRPSELEAQNGTVARLGREVGISTPTHVFLYASLLPQELHARRKVV